MNGIKQGMTLFYDYAQTVEWNEAEMSQYKNLDKFEKTGGHIENLDHFVIGTFTISFKMKFLQPMSNN